MTQPPGFTDPRFPLIMYVACVKRYMVSSKLLVLGFIGLALLEGFQKSDSSLLILFFALQEKFRF